MARSKKTAAVAPKAATAPRTANGPRLDVNSKVAALLKAQGFTRGEGDAATANYASDGRGAVVVKTSAVWTYSPTAGDPASGKGAKDLQAALAG